MISVSEEYKERPLMVSGHQDPAARRRPQRLGGRRRAALLHDHRRPDARARVDADRSARSHRPARRRIPQRRPHRLHQSARVVHVCARRRRRRDAAAPRSRPQRAPRRRADLRRRLRRRRQLPGRRHHRAADARDRRHRRGDARRARCRRHEGAPRRAQPRQLHARHWRGRPAGRPRRARHRLSRALAHEALGACGGPRRARPLAAAVVLPRAVRPHRPVRSDPVDRARRTPPAGCGRARSSSWPAPASATPGARTRCAGVGWPSSSVEDTMPAWLST